MTCHCEALARYIFGKAKMHAYWCDRDADALKPNRPARLSTTFRKYPQVPTDTPLEGDFVHFQDDSGRHAVYLIAAISHAPTHPAAQCDLVTYWND